MQIESNTKNALVSTISVQKKYSEELWSMLKYLLEVRFVLFDVALDDDMFLKFRKLVHKRKYIEMILGVYKEEVTNVLQ